MTRALPEWRGRSDDTPAPARVRLRIFEAHGGCCAGCGRKFRAGEAWELDHRIALVNGGENRETNLQPLCRGCHAPKTAQDVAQKSKDRRVRAKHTGAHRPKRKMPYRKFNGKIVWN